MKENIKEIIFATSNQNKINEVSSQLKLTNIKIISLHDLNFTEDIPETSNTFEGNAFQKSSFVHEKFNANVFSEDSGLEIDALGMEPGVYSARYAGIDRDDNQNMTKVLNKLKDIENRSAQFQTVISLIIDDQNYFFEGIVRGKIDLIKTGVNGFGYDPIFIPEGYKKSFAHFTKEEKNKISHRGIALGKLISFLSKL